MGFAWMVLVAYVDETLSIGSRSALLEVPLAALWMTAIDLMLDPVAANHLGYWHWSGKGAYYGIPASNFLGWFAVNLALFALIRRKHGSIRRRGSSGQPSCCSLR